MDITGIGLFIMIVIFTCINLAVFHKYVFCIYFSGTAVFREIFYSFLLAFVEVGLIVKVFTGVFSVLLDVIKFLLKLALILAVIAAIVFILSKVLPKIIPKVAPVMTKLSSLIKEKMHMFAAKHKKAGGDTAKENYGPENGVNNANIVKNKKVFCNKCGSKLLEGAVFCQKCGERVYSNESVENAALFK